MVSLFYISIKSFPEIFCPVNKRLSIWKIRNKILQLKMDECVAARISDKKLADKMKIYYKQKFAKFQKCINKTTPQ